MARMASALSARLADRITLNVARLQSEGVLGPEEVARLRGLAEKSGLPRLAANVFLIFGVILVVAGVLALQPPIDTGLVLAALAIASGSGLMARAGQDWGVLGRALVLMGILGLCGWAGFRMSDLGAPWPRLIWPSVTLLLLTGTLVYRDAFLAALAPIALSGAVGGGAGYWHASYGIQMQEPSLSILVFTTLATTLLLLRDQVPDAYRNVTVLMARTSFFMLNFGFWIGSLWGDHLGEIMLDSDGGWEAWRAWRETAFFVPTSVFTIGWAVFLLIAMAVGIRTHRRFLANTAVVFLCIHFYTQLHETLIFQPAGIVASGFILVAIGVGLVRFDRWQRSVAA